MGELYQDWRARLVRGWFDACMSLPIARTRCSFKSTSALSRRA